MRGGVTYSRNNIKAGTCENINGAFPESNGRNGEFRLGVHFSYRTGGTSTEFFWVRIAPFIWRY